MVIRTFGIGLILAAFSGWAGETLLFSHPTASVVEVENTSRPAAAATVDRVDGQPIIFAVDDRAGFGRQWFMPVAIDVAADCRITYQLSSDNVGRYGTDPNVYLVLTSRIGGQDKVISLFSAAGPKDGVAAALEFSTANGRYAIKGIYVGVAARNNGRATLMIEQLRIDYIGNIRTSQALDAILAEPPPVTAGLRAGEAAVDIMINGQPVIPLSCAARRSPTEQAYQEMTAGGVTFYRVTINGGGIDKAYPDSPSIWPYREYFDYIALDKALRPACVSGAYITVELLLTTPPAWWDSAQVAAARLTPCDCDDNWREYSKLLLRQVLAFIRQQSYADRVVGCHVLLGRGADAGEWPDQDVCCSTAFRQWLAQQYKTDVALQRAWNQDDVTLATVAPVPIALWPRINIMSLIHPAGDRSGLDTMRFYNMSWMKTQLHYAQLIKEYSHGRYLTGIIDGPAMFDRKWDDAYAIAALQPALDSPHVDFLEVPTSSAAPHIAGNVNVELVLSKPIRDHGKLLWLRPDDGYWPVNALRSVFAVALTEGAGIHIDSSVPENMHNDRVRLPTELQNWAAIMGKVGSRPRSRYRELAIVVDPYVGPYLALDRGQPSSRHTPGEPFFRDQTEARRHYMSALARIGWNQSGVPWETVFIDDLIPQRYKTILFLHTIQTTARRRAILENCKSNGRSVVSLWADGLFADGEMVPGHQREMVGINIRMVPRNVDFELKPTAALVELMQPNERLSPDLSWWEMLPPGPEIGIGPMFVVEDEDAKILAHYQDGTDAVAMKPFPDWTSFYAASPAVDPAVLRIAARRSGAHVYLDTNDFIFVSDAFIAIYTREAGVRNLKMPYPEPLYEVFRDVALERNDKHAVQLRENRTYVFFRGEKAAWTATQ
jgi:hypothetical protein